MLQMFYVTVWNESAEDLEDENVRKNLRLLAMSQVLRDELIELLKYSFDKIALVGEAIELGFENSLELHCDYSMRQIATAMDYFNYGALQGLGVKYFPEKRTDVFFVTLNKTDKDYSPTTMYNDYSINERLFHWQSQSTTSAESQPGSDTSIIGAPTIRSCCLSASQKVTLLEPQRLILFWDCRVYQA